ncbi:dihydrolipoyl dehydrogenase family protein [Tropicimonas sp.]|uniref:dihydrolipoyl dehydrogenase family protein n=1 Tax=Tropicimonas sp. TaxID=2067044 RepID=UPI003A88F0D4
MRRIRTDLCVIGAGAGGLSLAAGAVQLGARVVLLEGGRMGGDCLNHGCVPSKALIAAARHAHMLGSGGAFGIAPVAPRVNFDAVMDHVRRSIATIAPHDSQQRFEELGVEVIRDYGRFTAPDEVRAGDTAIVARRFVIATGSSPALPQIPGLADVPYLTNETLFGLRDLPEHLIVIGGGAIGVEMAQAFRRLGSAVTVVEAADVLGGEDRELAGLLVGRLSAEGVAFRQQTTIGHVRTENGQIAVETTSGGFRGSHLLVATGRCPNLGSLGLDVAGVAHDDAGVAVDAHLRSSNRRVYAIGDVTGGMQQTHVASHHAGVVARTILFGLPARARQDIIPRAIFTDPELARIGATEMQARARHGERLEVIREPFSANDRAVVEGGAEGLVKLLAVRGHLVGVAILGPGAGDLIAPWALMAANRMPLRALSGAVLPYPTLGEAGKRAAGAYFSPRLFDNPWIKRLVGIVQRHVP